MKIGYEKIICGDCGKEYEAMVIDRHISQPTICEDCFKKILLEMLDKESKDE